MGRITKDGGACLDAGEVDVLALSELVAVEDGALKLFLVEDAVHLCAIAPPPSPPTICAR